MFSLIVSIRVIAGFLAGMAAGILIMRAVYKSKGVIAVPATSEGSEKAMSAKVG